MQCDFRGANLDGLRFNNTVFDRCKFFDTTGKPDLEGPCTLIDPDFSSRGDGWASSIARRKPGLLARPWPALEGRSAELAAAKVIDLTDDRRLFAQLLETLAVGETRMAG